MIPHTFIFQPGKWIGEGQVIFTISPDKLHFYTSWEVASISHQVIVSLQQVEIGGLEPAMRNSFIFSNLTENSFDIELENEILGKVKGKGIIAEKKIAWEFHGQGILEGLEVYDLVENGEYRLHAEYVSTDQFRTIIDGRIWKKID